MGKQNLKGIFRYEIFERNESFSDMSCENQSIWILDESPTPSLNNFIPETSSDDSFSGHLSLHVRFSLEVLFDEEQAINKDNLLYVPELIDYVLSLTDSYDITQC